MKTNLETVALKELVRNLDRVRGVLTPYHSSFDANASKPASYADIFSVPETAFYIYKWQA
ncbi:hypothetical protein S1G_2872 [Escherichia coli B95]|nr:hypothetical protein S1G_2872 [Escherichia coli B95]